MVNPGHAMNLPAMMASSRATALRLISSFCSCAGAASSPASAAAVFSSFQKALLTV